MEDILRPIYQERASQIDTMGILMMVKREKTISITDNFDVVLLIIVKEAEQPVLIKHYSYQDKQAAMHIVTKAQLDLGYYSGPIVKSLIGYTLGKSFLIAMSIFII